jgi:c-di-GMP-binding flagellar brake protein YcgR
VEAIRFILRSNDLVAVLGRDIPVRLLNFSGSGCLVATSTSVHEGATASMRLDIGGIEYTDHVRVVRCTRVEGASEYHLGLEFLWIAAPDERSMRRLPASLQPAAATASGQGNTIEFAKP